MSDLLRSFRINEQMSESLVFSWRIAHSLFCSPKTSNSLKKNLTKIVFIGMFLKLGLCARGGTAARKGNLPWVLLGMRAVPREESVVSASEAALQQ